jgi:hypothetical protein
LSIAVNLELREEGYVVETVQHKLKRKSGLGPIFSSAQELLQIFSCAEELPQR